MQDLTCLWYRGIWHRKVLEQHALYTYDAVLERQGRAVRKARQAEQEAEMIPPDSEASMWGLETSFILFLKASKISCERDTPALGKNDPWRAHAVKTTADYD